VRPAYGSVLVPLFEEDGLRMGELARRAHLSKQTMTALIQRLERDGLVVRHADPGDRRASVISLTDRGHRFRPVAEAAMRRLDAQVRARLGDRTDDLRRSLTALRGLEPPRR
jgi:DNA-binding MarR family transcriptional regulator